MADINVTPLVDVMLVLLIIFMITAPMMTQGLEVNLPETTGKAIRQDDKPIEITGLYFVRNLLNYTRMIQEKRYYSKRIKKLLMVKLLP